MATQPTSAPTRKLATMLIGVPALYTLLGPAAAEWWPQVAPAAMAGEAFTALVSAVPAVILTGIVAYFVPDAPNVPDE